jgi:diguanylate cyclase (GGDEF)-like protein
VEQVEEEQAFARCVAAADLRAACRGVVDDLHDRWPLPSAYLLVDGRLRCMASRGYFQVSDGFTTSTGVIGRVITTGLTEVLQDVHADPSFVAAAGGLRAEVCVPVRVHGRVVGAVNLESRDLLPPAAVADAERAAAVLGRRLEELGGLPPPSMAERLAHIAVDLAGQTTVAQVRGRALAGAQELSGLSTAALAELTEDGWSVSECVGPLAHVVGRWDADVLDRLAGWVQAKTSSYFPPGEQVPPGHEFLAGDVRALSVQPLVAAGPVTGLLLTADTEPGAPDPTVTAAMELLALHTAAMLAVARSVEELSRQATRDPLTGLRNRRGLLELLQRSAGEGGWALVLLDLDGFKAVNDLRGHARGDAVLSDVAESLTAAAPDGALVFRLGGDEFAMLAPGLDGGRAAADLGAQLVRAAAQSSRLEAAEAVGASAGVRLLDPASAASALADADDALYAAKRGGGRRAVVWSPELSLP